MLNMLSQTLSTFAHVTVREKSIFYCFAWQLSRSCRWMLKFYLEFNNKHFFPLTNNPFPWICLKWLIPYRFSRVKKMKQEGNRTCISIIVEPRSSIIIITRCFIPDKTRPRSQTLFLFNLRTTWPLPSNRVFVIRIVFFWCPSNSIILNQSRKKNRMRIPWNVCHISNKRKQSQHVGKSNIWQKKRGPIEEIGNPKRIGKKDKMLL